MGEDASDDGVSGEEPGGGAGGGGAGGGGAGGGGGERARGAAAAETAVPSATPITPGASAASTSPLVISEIMYHPVLEDSAVDEHEFIEIHNRSKEAVSLGGWKVAGVISHELKAATALPAGGYLVLAKNPMRLRADVPAYELDPQRVLGPYAGELDNGGGVVSLIDPAGAVRDAVKYSDKFPWPIGADALGAGESWFAAGDPRLPFAAHKYQGISLERVNDDLAGDVSNWSPSALDAPTPGKPPKTPAEPPPIVTSIAAAPNGAEPPIRPEHNVSVTVRLSSTVGRAPRLEWFVDDLARTDEPRSTIDLAPAPEGVYAGTIPAQKGSSIVRYRVLLDRGGELKPVSPRPSDPYGWHAYFVATDVDPVRRTHHLYLAGRDWTKLWQNIKAGLWMGAGLCQMNPTWNDRVAAVFVHDGRVHDVRVRYSGSYAHRVRGQNVDVAKWKGSPAPTEPSPLKALSFSIKFPAYNELDKKRTIVLNKMNNNCSGIEWLVTSRLFKSLGIAVPQVRFARLNVNGGYFHYTLEIDDWDEKILENAYGAELAGGDLFNVAGLWGQAMGRGVLGPGDGSEIQPMCGFSAAERYRATYPRASPSWKGDANDEVVTLVKDLNAARRSGQAAIRAFFQANFDAPSLIDYMSVTEWAAAWDDIAHNYLLYRFPAPKNKWTMLPWDFDIHIGGFDWPNGGTSSTTKPPTASFYFGKAGDPWSGQTPSLWKDAFFQAYDAEYRARLKQLADGPLNPSKSVLPLIDQWVQEFSREDWTSDPATKFCDPWAHADRMRKWVMDRDAALRKAFP